eukprot:11750049-Prorocentrum_lima.AAC.1
MVQLRHNKQVDHKQRRNTYLYHLARDHTRMSTKCCPVLDHSRPHPTTYSPTTGQANQQPSGGLFVSRRHLHHMSNRQTYRDHADNGTQPPQ